MFFLLSPDISEVAWNCGLSKENTIASDPNCELCQHAGGTIVWQDDQCRIVRVVGPEGADYPGFCRVIWQEHVREMSDLSGFGRKHLMALVFATEAALRKLYAPAKINLASLGNLVPHLHWHVIPRFVDDPHFPMPIWAGTRLQEATRVQRPNVSNTALLQAISGELQQIGNDA